MCEEKCTSPKIHQELPSLELCFSFSALDVLRWRDFRLCMFTYVYLINWKHSLCFVVFLCGCGLIRPLYDRIRTSSWFRLRKWFSPTYGSSDFCKWKEKIIRRGRSCPDFGKFIRILVEHKVNCLPTEVAPFEKVLKRRRKSMKQQGWDWIRLVYLLSPRFVSTLVHSSENIWLALNLAYTKSLWLCEDWTVLLN